MLRRHLSPNRLTLILSGWIVALLITRAFSQDHVTETWRTNLLGVSTVEALLSKGNPDPNTLASDIRSSCPGFMAGSWAVSDSQLIPEQRMQLLNQLTACWSPERAQLLASWQISTLWSLGRYAEACDSAVTVDAPDRLLELALLASETGNWKAVETSLECIPRFQTGVAWVSPYIVAQLYNRIGQQHELMGWTDRAIAAYDAAARWYPVVWSDPYLHKAALLVKQGRDGDVIQWLQDGLVQSTDATATFNLWDALGDYWQHRGHIADALCAYQTAAGLVDRVPEQDLPASRRAGLRDKINSLDDSAAAECFELFPLLKAVAQRP